MPEEERGSTTEELTSEQQRDNVIRLAFGGSHDRFNEFVSIVREAIPPATGVVLRGSAVTGERWKDGAPFDADGPGTSDLDLTLVGGDEVIGLYKVTGFWPDLGAARAARLLLHACRILQPHSRLRHCEPLGGGRRLRSPPVARGGRFRLRPVVRQGSNRGQTPAAIS